MAEEGKTPKAGHNGLAEAGKAFVDRIENLERDIQHEQEAAAEVIKPIRQDIARVLKEAESAGLTPKSIRAVVKARKLARKAAEARTKLDIADRDTFDNIRHALGDLRETPLGASALATAAAAFGEVVPLTDEEKAAGVIVAFVDKDGVRSSIGTSRIVEKVA